MLKLWWSFFRIGAMNELQYRVNFFVQIFQALMALGTGLVGLALVFAHTSALNGWTRPAILAVMGIHIMMGGIITAAIQPNMQRLMDEVQQGTLDYALTKPADSQWLISVREVRIWQMVDFFSGLIVLIVAIIQLQAGLGLVASLAFVAAIFMGGLMIYSFWLIMTTTAFWVVRMDSVIELFQGVYQAGRWPITIYPNWLQAGLTFLVPIAFAVTVPAEALTGRLNALTLLGALALTALLLTLARWYWRIGVRRYSGASA